MRFMRTDSEFSNLFLLFNVLIILLYVLIQSQTKIGCFVLA